MRADRVRSFTKRGTTIGVLAVIATIGILLGISALIATVLTQVF